ncbi:MAG: nucleotidyltransferase family protein [Chloroflexota bacterium]|nr:nucleotidyltransferase family protein [Chloroflexota bacterium]
MGRQKQLLRLGTTTFLQHTLQVAACSHLDEVVVVIAPALADHCSLDGSSEVRRVVNPTPEDGQSSSLRLGLASLTPECSGALVLMCDQPGVTVRLVNHLLEAWRAQPNGALVPTYHRKRGTPALLGAELWPLAAQLTGDTGARVLFRAHPEMVRTIEVGHLGTPEDINTPAEYAGMLDRTS